MLKMFEDAAGKAVLIDTAEIEFAYTLEMFDDNAILVGLKSGKKLFIRDVWGDIEKFWRVCRETKDRD